MKFKKTLFGKIMIMSIIIELIMLTMLILASYSFKLNERKDSYITMGILLVQSSNLRLEMQVKRDSGFTKLFQNNHKRINDNLKVCDSIAREVECDPKLYELKDKYEFYLDKSHDLVLEFGLNENDGIEGMFRERIHAIEDVLQQNNNEKVLIHMLQARRREKDFIMRNREKYAQQVHDIISDLKEEVKNSVKLPESKKNEIISLANDYDIAFRDFVDITFKISENEKLLYDIENKMKSFISEIVKSEITKSQNYQASLIPLFFISIIVSIILSIIISRSITKPLISLKHATIKISDGDFKIKVKAESKDEIGELAVFFNKMTENISKANETIMNQQQELNVQYSELKQINATRDKFFSIIAHDLKNPIGAFMNVSDFLTKTFHELSRDEIKDFLEAVNSSAKNLYELLENLLLWSRSQRGQIQFNPMNLELTTLIIGNIDLLKVNADNKQIAILYDIEQDTSIFADPNMFNTILRNLITNAIKFTHENGLINIKAFRSENICQITVTDNGVGIPPENIDTLFKLENSVSTSGTREETGTGLGLILCKEFVEKNGGKIWVESTVNVGSKFHFILPLAQNELIDIED